MRRKRCVSFMRAQVGVACLRQSPAISSASRVRLHLAPENLIHMCLIPLSPAAKPSKYIRVHTKTNELLDRAVKTSYLNVGW